jgi:RNA polymerase I-specific transcription initiation factor RRN6
VHPDFAASWSSIREEPLSKTVTTTTEQYDPEVSTLFDLGYAVDQRRHDKKLRSVPIAVAVTGDCRNIISLRTLEEEILELTSPEKLAFRVPSIDTTEMSQWSDCGAPIRQVCFARPVEEKPIFMAARLPTATMIFRPLYHWDPVPMRFPDNALMGSSIPLQNSRLDANPIVKVSLSQTGGFPHADVTFNPWYQKQFAIVDTRGNWSVWEITGRQRLKLATWSTALVKAGSMPSQDPTRKHSSARLDGWASIEWVHSVGSVVVSNRRSVIIYAFTDDQVPPRTVELGIAKQSEWVLGLQRNPRSPSQFFVLTTTRILWFDIGCLPGEDDTNLSLHPRASWRHFRDPEDTTLQLSNIVVYQGMW